MQRCSVRQSPGFVTTPAPDAGPVAEDHQLPVPVEFAVAESTVLLPPFWISGPPATARISSRLNTCMAVGVCWIDEEVCVDGV